MLRKQKTPTVSTAFRIFRLNICFRVPCFANFIPKSTTNSTSSPFFYNLHVSDTAATSYGSFSSQPPHIPIRIRLPIDAIRTFAYSHYYEGGTFMSIPIDTKAFVYHFFGFTIHKRSKLLFLQR